MPCDVLIPAAIGGVVTAENAAQLQCKFLVEAANGPTTPGGDQVLRDRGIVVLPDIYTNGGCAVLCAVHGLGMWLWTAVVHGSGGKAWHYNGGSCTACCMLWQLPGRCLGAA
jgi:hypothetical protein